MNRPGEQCGRSPPEGTDMATYIALLDYTDQGVRNIKDSPQRADEFNELAESSGARVLAQYWTIGSHDGVLILDARSGRGVDPSEALSVGERTDDHAQGLRVGGGPSVDRGELGRARSAAD